MHSELTHVPPLRHGFGSHFRGNWWAHRRASPLNSNCSDGKRTRDAPTKAMSRRTTGTHTTCVQGGGGLRSGGGLKTNCEKLRKNCGKLR